MGVLPGDMVLSINDVDFQQLSIDEMNRKLSSEGPSELKLVLLPSEDSMEWSSRSVYLNYSEISTLRNKLANFPDFHRIHYEDLIKNQVDDCDHICIRSWIKTNGNFSGIGGLFVEVRISLFVFNLI